MLDTSILCGLLKVIIELGAARNHCRDQNGPQLPQEFIMEGAVTPNPH
jgi:hypothetical protein